MGNNNVYAFKSSIYIDISPPKMWYSHLYVRSNR